MLSTPVAETAVRMTATPCALPTPPFTPPLAMLLSELAASNYRFITPTPLTHQRVMERRTRTQQKPDLVTQSCPSVATLRDIFGWNLRFDSSTVRQGLLELMADAGILQSHGGLFSSTVRVSSIADDLFVHSAHPTTQDDAVFFGPDTYRFARFVQQGLALRYRLHATPGPFTQALRVLDVGCGSGAGGVVAARCLSKMAVPHSIEMNDINPLALRYTAINAAYAGIPITLAEGDTLSAVTGQLDLVISNPPYLDDASARVYRHGGDRLGRALSARIAAEALARLAPGGQLLLYTGVAMVGGADPFLAEIRPLLAQSGVNWSYAEIDPDVFGEELEQPLYAHVDRIAAVGLVATRYKSML